MKNEKKVSGQSLGSDDRRTYQKPVLTIFNDLRTLTLAPSPVPDEESYNGGTRTGRSTFPEGIGDQFFEERSSRSSSSDGGRGGRSS